MSSKFALIIGNSEYDDMNLSSLTAPAADVRALDELLRAPEIGGFDAVQTLANRPFAEVHPAIADFFADKKPDDLLLLYFSGHGLLDPQGRLYLAVKNTRDPLSGSAIASHFIKEEMDGSRARRQVLILDCCQSGAFGQGAKGAPGAQAITDATFEGRGRVVLTATDKTQPAWEGNRIIGGVETSIFTHFIVEGLKTGAAADDAGRITPTRLYEYIFPKVVEAAPTQKPRLIVYDREGGDIVIARSPRPPAPTQLPIELQLAINSPSAEVRAGALEELGRLIRGNNPALATAALEALKQLSLQMTERSRLSHEQQQEIEEAFYPPKTEPATVSAPDLLVLEYPFHLELIRIPAGKFLMEDFPARNEKSQHRIDLPELHSAARTSVIPSNWVDLPEFYISKHPITNAQYAIFVKATDYRIPSHWTKRYIVFGEGAIPVGKENHPVVNVSWDDAMAFCQWLTKGTGKRFRLPTEAEWEKAARGADGRIYPWGNEWDPKKLNSYESGVGGTTPVGKYSPAGDSPYGLADMSGNVWEWCADWYDEWYDEMEYQRRSGSAVKDPLGPKTGTEHALRGGSWYDRGEYARVVARSFHNPSFDYWKLNGFRVRAFPD